MFLNAFLRWLFIVNVKCSMLYCVLVNIVKSSAQVPSRKITLTEDCIFLETRSFPDNSSEQMHLFVGNAALSKIYSKPIFGRNVQKFRFPKIYRPSIQNNAHLSDYYYYYPSSLQNY